MTRRRSKPDGPKGVLYVDKPVGPTSHDAVGRARRSLGERRVGHTGTLDPFATGLLILLVGPATRLAETFAGLEKRYRATVRLGVETDTADHTGEVVSTTDLASVFPDGLTEDQLEACLARQRGTIDQLPPKYSAKKIDGEAAYRRARRGEAVELEPSRVTIHELVCSRLAPPEVDIDLRCSTGTYVRSIGRDLGADLGVGGHLTALRRTGIGPYSVTDAIPWSALEDPSQAQAALVPSSKAFEHLPHFDVSAEAAERLRNGREVALPGAALDGPALAVHQGLVLSVGLASDSTFQPQKVFPHGA